MNNANPAKKVMTEITMKYVMKCLDDGDLSEAIEALKMLLKLFENK